jgi:SpoVK/Ycf46/Vps4 family AAA+-type ATPase
MQYKKQVVLYDPPDTGKTYRAKRLAEGSMVNDRQKGILEPTMKSSKIRSYA